MPKKPDRCAVCGVPEAEAPAHSAGLYDADTDAVKVRHAFVSEAGLKRTAKVSAPHAIYHDSRMPGWEWRVLKLYKGIEAGRADRYARAFCLVTSPMTGPGGDMGDCYLTDIGDTLVSGVAVR